MRWRGCAYYPEYWGMERVETDARLMREAGINLARIAEFAWTRLEPAEGRFTFDWLHHAIEMLGRHDISVLVCTPTAAPPAWLTESDPSTLTMMPEGRLVRHGSRRHSCPTSPAYRRHCARITAAMATACAAHVNVMGWQIDNELGPEAGAYCHCPACQESFRSWLRQRYRSIDELNVQWGTGFWSHDYSDWSQVRLGWDRDRQTSARMLDSRRFFSQTYVDFTRHQAGIIRANHPDTKVVTNGMGAPIYSVADYHALFSDLDAACDDLYFDLSPIGACVTALEIFRSYKPGKASWITETGSGALDHNLAPPADQLRAWAWSGVAHGAEMWSIFRWRTCLSGQEQELQGMLEHSGHPGHRYRAVQTMFTELAQWQTRLAALPLPRAEIAAILDYDVIWGYESSRVSGDVGVDPTRIGTAMMRRGAHCDWIPPGRDLGQYRLLLLPMTMMIDAAFARRLDAFVRGGGVLLAIGQIGIRDRNDNYLPHPGPDHLQALLGVELVGGAYLTRMTGPDESLFPRSSSTVTATIAGSVEGVGRRWIADVSRTTGEVLASFSDGPYRGQPAQVRTATGAGESHYLATADPDDAWWDAALNLAWRRAGLAVEAALPVHVERLRRGDLTIAINHGETAATIRLDTGKTLLGTVEDGIARLPPYSVVVVEHPVTAASTRAAPPGWTRRG